MPASEANGGETERPGAASAEPAALVVGAGPVGLTLACELWRHGVRCRIVDAGEGPTSPRESRALGIQARSLEVLDDLGVADRLVPPGRRLRAANAYHHGRRFARFEVDFDHLGTPYPFVLTLPQGDTERRLIERLGELGGSVQWQTRLADVRHDGQGATATLVLPRGGQQAVRTGWLVGCDGIHSTVRKRLGLAFAGTRYEETFLLADARLRWDLSQDEAHLLLVRGGPLAAIPLPEPGRWRLIDATGGARAESPQEIVARFDELLREAGVAAAIEHADWTSSFRIHRRTVDRLRVGRCFLAGDAAHVHSPVGGQGMNTGIQDAYNLGWKLAAVIAGGAPAELLDSYDAERGPVAAGVLRGTDWATRAVTLRNPVARAVRDALIARLAHRRFVRRRLTASASELNVDYRHSGWVSDDARRSFFTASPGAGERVPDLEMAENGRGPSRLFDLLRGTHHTLLLFEGEPASEAAARVSSAQSEFEALPRVVQQYRAERLVAYRVFRSASGHANAASGAIVPLPDPEGRLHRHFGARRASAYAIRPDGYVGYRGGPPNAERLANYLDRLLGPSTDSADSAGKGAANGGIGNGP